MLFHQELSVGTILAMGVSSCVESKVIPIHFVIFTSSTHSSFFYLFIYLSIRLLSLPYPFPPVLVGGNLYLYDTRGEKFECFKVVTGRDIGWSIVSTAFRSVPLSSLPKEQNTLTLICDNHCSPDQQWFLYTTWSSDSKFGSPSLAVPLSPLPPSLSLFSL